MPQQFTSLTVFISCTSEMEAEKTALARVVTDLSTVLEKTHKITLRAISWPGSIYSATGADPQSVINEQTGDNYDIYIGILGTRFGSSTPRWGSGTEEEFRRALARFEGDSTSVRILFYFKQSLTNPFTIDLPQLQSVLAFRTSLGDFGQIYYDFTDTVEFTEKTRNHLHNLIIDQWNLGSWKHIALGHLATREHSDAAPNAPFANSIDEANAEHLAERQTEAEEDLGLLEIDERFQGTSARTILAIQNITRRLTNIQETSNLRTLELEAITSHYRDATQNKGEVAAKEISMQAREVINQTAADLDNFSVLLGADLQAYKSANRAMFVHLTQLVALKREMGTPAHEGQTDRDALTQMIDQIMESQASITAFQSTIASLPPLTKQLKAARRSTATVLGEVIAELQFSIDETKLLVRQLNDE